MRQERNLVEKSNALNTMMCESIQLTEFRFFCLYLSRLNARDDNIRTINISVKEFESFFHIRLNTNRFNKEINKIAGRTISIKEDGKIKVLTLYSEFCWNEKRPSTITITCNDKMLPYIFDLKRNYTTYVVGNIAKLNCVSKIRFYEICKQYEKISPVTMNLTELQRMMCVNLSQFRDFRSKRLDPAVKDINLFTDITVSYEKILFCRKVVSLKLDIKKKEDLNKESKENKINFSENDPIHTLYCNCNKEYTMDQLNNLVSLAKMFCDKPEAYIFSVYIGIEPRSRDIKNIYKYTIAIIQKELVKLDNNSKQKRESTIDIDEWERRVITAECVFNK